ncbi:MAG TPA: response regulator [Syntrophobacteraceae bacterium]|nr:response regulator [Syntrophobacteraceae bacterium]
MLRILLVSARREAFRSFTQTLSLDPEVRIEVVPSGAEALAAVRIASPQLAVIDSELPDTDAMLLVRDLMMVNAMINTAVVSSLSEEQFHEVSEGLGVLARLPLVPGKRDATELLEKLRKVTGG